MYAVIHACGKQYRVKKGDTVQLDLLQQKLGDEVSFTEVLLTVAGESVQIGRPFVENASVKAEVLSLEKGPKIDIMQYKRRKQFKRHVGHRQPYTRVLITEVKAGSNTDSLSKADRDAIIKRVGFSLRDELSPAAAVDEAAQVKRAEKVKARAIKHKEKDAVDKVSSTKMKKSTLAKKAAAKTAKTKKPAVKKAVKKED